MPGARAPLQPPTGPYYVATSLSQAQAWATAVDAQQGYPRAGVFALAGPFQPATPFVTQTYSEILQHPTLSQWAYPSNSVTDAVLVGTNGLPAAAALTTDWGGTQPAPAAVGLSLAHKLAIGAAAAAGVAAAVVSLLT